MMVGFLGAGLAIHLNSLLLMCLTHGVSVGAGLGCISVVAMDVMAQHFSRLKDMFLTFIIEIIYENIILPVIL